MSHHEEEVLGKVYDGRLARRLLGYLKPYRHVALLAVALTLGASALQLAGPYLTKIAIDGYILRPNLGGLNRIALLFLVFLSLQFSAAYLQNLLVNWMGQKIMFDMRLEIYRHLQRLEIAFFDRNPVGRLMTRITSDVDVLNELFTSGVITIFGDVFTLAGIVVVIFSMNPRLALVTFSVIPFLFAASVIFKIRVRHSYRRVRAAIARINAFLQENITGMAITQLFGQQRRKFSQFAALNEEHRAANQQSIFYYAVFYPLAELIGAVAIALILWYGGNEVLRGALTLGSLVAFIQYSDRFYKPISDLSEKFNTLQGAMASSERIFKLLDTPVHLASPRRPHLLPKVRGAIEFRNVSFQYKENEPVLRNISLTVAPGERIAIVGATGAGKSTIISLLNRFYDTREGAILIDGVDIREMSLDQLRQSIGIVLQDVFLFSGTIADNIRLHHPQITLDAMQRAAQAVNADRVVEKLPGRLEHRLGERGSSLSAGERQLLSFARCLAYDPVILVLDEATSNIDTETEILIRDGLAKLMKNRTSIVIAHRLSTIQNCDRILVMHKGEICEAGSHQELLRQRGIYYKLYQLQYKDQLAATGTNGS
ncbi:MAG: ABC transporter ATP-binding protein [Acidobacteria bacterium]|nr:ABC transporter ATP-binding protein [Acidobacteriota bacterium]